MATQGAWQATQALWTLPVSVTAGPIDRLLGVTTVQLHTAAATTDATIPGLEPAIAAALRDRLARQGEMRGAGL